MSSPQQPEPKHYARDMSRTPWWDVLLDYWKNNCWLQLAAFCFLIAVIILYLAIFRMPPEDNPNRVTGQECQFPGMKQERVISEGKPVQTIVVDKRWRMTGGDNLLLIENNNRSQTFDIYLFPGRFTLAYRLKARQFDTGDFEIIGYRPDNQSVLRIYEDFRLLGHGWRADRTYINSDGGIFQFQVNAPDGLRWCIEIAETRS